MPTRPFEDLPPAKPPPPRTLAGDLHRLRQRLVRGALGVPTWVLLLVVGGLVAGVVALALGERSSVVADEAKRARPPAQLPAEEQESPAIVARARPVPILMYHVIAAPPADAPYPELFVSPGAFAAEMRYLAKHGYHVVTLQQVYDFWHRGGSLPRLPIVVSFDDGFRNWYTAAYPIMRRHGWAGTMNVAVSHLNGIDMSARWLRRLVAAGWEVDSHSLTHPDLTQLDGEALTREVAGSRAKLRRLVHAPVNFFCYPSGRYDNEVIAAVRAAGYFGATTTRPGLAKPRDRFTLARIRIARSDGVAGLANKLAAVKPRA